jgi:hypothetical protein
MFTIRAYSNLFKILKLCYVYDVIKLKVLISNYSFCQYKVCMIEISNFQKKFLFMNFQTNISFIINYTY